MMCKCLVFILGNNMNTTRNYFRPHGEFCYALTDAMNIITVAATP